MKALRSLCFCALVCSLVPSLASAGEPSLADWAKARIETTLLRPLAQVQVHRFSRERPMPRERRVRILDTNASLDKGARAFVPFAVDIRFGSDFREDFVGCIYKGSGSIFVKRGDEYRPAAFLLGKKADPVPGVCEAVAPARS